MIPDTIDEVIDRWREAERQLASVAPAQEARPEAPRLDRSSRGVLVAAMTWILVLTTLATIAVGVPGALDVFAQRSPHRPTQSAHPSTPSPAPETVSGRRTDVRSTGGSGCERPACIETEHGQPTEKKKRTHPGPEDTPGSQAQAGQANEHQGTEQGQANANDNGASHIPPTPGEGSPGQDVKAEATEGGLKERRQGAGSDVGSSNAVVSMA